MTWNNIHGAASRGLLRAGTPLARRDIWVMFKYF